jgi:phosphosulfolactate synthase (CoM biosynthesis protein A)
LSSSDTEAPEETGTPDPEKILSLSRRFLDEAVERIMIESEGITKNVKTWRTDVISKIGEAFPINKIMSDDKTATKLIYDCH